MVKNNYSFSEFEFSSQLIRDLTAEKKQVQEFAGDFFSHEALQKKIMSKTFSIEKRQKLYDSLTEQNDHINLSKETLVNISLIKNEKTFTITTGHQLNLMSGPLYSIYKIIQVIIWTEELKKKNPEYNFVPVFWMATEDHDFEEINHIHLFNNKIEWLKPDQENFIAGKIETVKFGEFETQILDKFSDDNIRAKVDYFLSFYKSTNLANATRLLMNDLFSEYGLVIIDGDDKRLKQEFLPVVEKELSEQVTFKKVKEVNVKLDKAGYHNQVHLRECNLFFIENNTTRHRIIRVENGFEINSRIYSTDEIMELAKNNPSAFSPNALMRPLYQELILPNLVYFGGGGEIAYWLQLKDLFTELNIDFPLLRVRDSYVLLPSKQIDVMNDLGYSVLDLKQNMDDLIKEFTKNNATSDIDMHDEFNLFNDLKLRLTKKVESQDLGIQRFLEGELVKIENQLEKVEKKLIQNEKKNLDQSIKKVKKLKEKIYPNNGFQERYENMLQYVSNPNFIKELKKEAEHSMNVQPQIKLFKF